eukprot:130851_1
MKRNTLLCLISLLTTLSAIFDHPFQLKTHMETSRRMLTTSPSLCSALKAYVEVSTTKNGTQDTFTMLSGQALFPPHSYYVNWTALVLLPTTDDICDQNSTSSIDITDRIVLLFESLGNCSVHSKVMWAQFNDASAVLMSNNDYSGVVHNIADDTTIDDQFDDTVIPVRSISKAESDRLQTFISTGYEVRIKIGCFDDQMTYPSVLCVTNNAVDISDPLMGEYQRQANFQFNSHPVWVLDGYAFWTNSLYMFLHDAKGDTDWYWAITTDHQLSSDLAINLKCTVGNLEDPTSCPLWATFNGTHIISENPDINVLGDVCNNPNETASSVCVESSNTQLSGLRGTYHLLWQGEIVWARELNECDQRSGLLSFEGSYFGFFEMWTGSIQAYCFLGPYWPYRPDSCPEWKIKLDDDLTTRRRWTVDDSFNITIGKCTDTPECVASIAPERMCLANNSVVNGNLMGEYVQLNTTGPHFNSPIYKRAPPQQAPWMHNTIWIWYLNEYNAQKGSGDNIHTRVWVLSPHGLDEALRRITTGEQITAYGYCFGYAHGNPASCQNWVFNANKRYQWDETVIATEGACNEHVFAHLPSVWPQYICLGLKNALLNAVDTAGYSFLSVSSITGLYELDATSINHTFPVWSKLYNDYEPNTMYLSFVDVFWRAFWEIKTDKVIKLHCDPYYKSDSLDPIDCKRWLDGLYEIVDNIYLYECTASDVKTASPTPSPTTPLPTIATTFPTTLPTLIPTIATISPTTAVPTSPTISPTAPTQTPSICLSRTGDTALQSILEGVYHPMQVAVGEFDTRQFAKEMMSGGLYVWFYDDKWALSAVDYSPKRLSNDNVYGYCPGDETTDGKLPICTGCWIFYWSKSSINCVGCAWIEDCSFQLHLGVSHCHGSGGNEVRYPAERLCLSPSANAEDDVDETLFGEYVYFNASGRYSLSEGFGVIWKDNITNFWFVGHTLGVPILLCDIPMLGLCWMMDQNQTPKVAYGIDISALSGKNECIVTREPSVSPTSVLVLSTSEISEVTGMGISGSEGKGQVAGIVIGILFGIICIVLGILLFWKYEKNKTTPQKSVEEREMIGTRDDQDTGGMTSTKTEKIAISEESDDEPNTDILPETIGDDGQDDVVEPLNEP